MANIQEMGRDAGGAGKQRVATAQDSVDLGSERLPQATRDFSVMYVAPESALGMRIQSIVNLTRSTDSSLVLRFFDEGVVRSCTVQALEGLRNPREFIVSTSDGSPLTPEKLNSSALSVPIASFNNQSAIPFLGGRYIVDVPLDVTFRADTAYAAFVAERSVGEQRFIVTRPDPDYPHKYEERLSSARFLGVEGEGVDRSFLFENDGGTQYSLLESDVRAISRAGKEGTLVRGGQRQRVEGAASGHVTEVVTFNSATVNQHFALYQNVQVVYGLENEKGGRTIEKFSGMYLGIYDVPSFQDGGQIAPGKSQSHVFLLGGEPDRKIFAVRASEIFGITGHVDNDHEIGGNSRKAALGKIPAYTSGTPLFKVESE